MKDSPFDLSPNPASLHLTASLKTTLHKTRYCIDKKRGITCILGDVGMGKSSIVRLLHAEYSAKDNTSVSMIPIPDFSSDFGLVKFICIDLGIPPKNSLVNQQSALLEWLTEQNKQGRNTLVIIDEAQAMSDKMLERIRQLLNLETNTTKLIQIVLAGQIELKERLLKTKQKAIRSRIFAPSILNPLSLSETKAMIEFRCERDEVPCPVPDYLFEQIYNLTAGIPRDILKLCDIAYELMCLNKAKLFTTELIEMASGEAAL
jgi:general secretion pathway protein A